MKISKIFYILICVLGVIGWGVYFYPRFLNYPKRVDTFLATLGNSASLLAVNDDREKAYPLVAYSENGVIKIYDLYKRKLIGELVTGGVVVQALPCYSVWNTSYVLNGKKVAPCNSNVIVFASYSPGTQVDMGAVYILQIDENGNGRFYKDSEGVILIDTDENNMSEQIASFICDSDVQRMKYSVQGRVDITNQTVGKYLTDNQIEKKNIYKIYKNQVLFYQKTWDSSLYCYSAILDREVTYPDCHNVFTQGDIYLFYSKSPDSGGRELVMVNPLTLHSVTLAQGQSVSHGVLDSYITVKCYDLSERYFTFEGEEIKDIDAYTAKQAIDEASSLINGFLGFFN